MNTAFAGLAKWVFALCLAACCLLPLCGGEPCNYQTHHVGQTAKSKDPMKEHLDRLKKETDAQSIYNLGVHYATGSGMSGAKANLPLALKQFELAAKENYPPAQLAAGYCYKLGLGTMKGQSNLEKAKDYFSEAANSNLPEAQFEFGMILKNSDMEKAKLHFEGAAALPEAQWQLAVLNSIGSSRNRNPAMECKWTYMAALNGHPEAIDKTNYWHRYRGSAAKEDLAARAEGLRLAQEAIAEARAKLPK